MAPRHELHQILVGILGSDHVYFQPPNGMKMVYPCVVYSRSNIRTNHADNLPYRNAKVYDVMVIDRDPDSILPDKVKALPTSRFDRHFVADNLNHDNFQLFY